jgi:hypothetical protein
MDILGKMILRDAASDAIFGPASHEKIFGHKIFRVIMVQN